MRRWNSVMAQALRRLRRGNVKRASALLRTALGLKKPARSRAPPQAKAGVGIRATQAPKPALLKASRAVARTLHASTGHFVAGRFTNTAGSRAYRLWIPSNPSGFALTRPLVVMLHGCLQDAENFASGTGMNEVAEARSTFVLYPIQTGSANAQRCWRWFQRSHQRRDHGEPAILAGMTQKILLDYAIDPTRVYVAGLSAGAAMAVVLAETYPDLYAAVGVHSGMPSGLAYDVASALAVMAGRPPRRHLERDNSILPRLPPPTIVFHGDRDTTVAPSNSESLVTDLKQRYLAATGSALSVTAEMQAAYTRCRFHTASGDIAIEQWTLHGVGHAWSGGNPASTYTDPAGPRATDHLMNFFDRHRLAPLVAQ